MVSKKKYDRRVMRLFDGYVHGQISRRQFLDRAAQITASATTAAAILASLSPDYSLAEQVDPDDKSITTTYKKYASPKGAGVMNGYYARPTVVEHKLPAVVVIHENRGLNPYIEDVARRLAKAGFIAFAADAAYVAYEYVDANHGFHNDTTPRYDASAAKLSWQRTTDFFAEHLDLGD